MQIKLDNPIDPLLKKITFRHILIAVILILTIFSRLINLGDRVMSHDEVNHVVPAFDLYSGRGYNQDPITHGPLQFHLMALSYFLFGDNDFTSRLPHALFSIATVAFVMVYFRRYLGKYGSIAAGIFFAISPFMMFYGRYARNDIICVFLSILSLYAVLRYMEEGKNKHLLLLIISLVLNFTAKETAYIFTAQLLVFLFILTVRDFIKIKWGNSATRREFFLFNALIILAVIAALGGSVLLMKSVNDAVLNGEIILPSIEQQTTMDFFSALASMYPLLKTLLPVLLILFGSIIFILVVREKMHWEVLTNSRSFGMLIVTGTMVLPLLSAFVVSLSGINPIDYASTISLFADYIYIAYMFSLAIVIGFIWRSDDWWKYALIFFGIFFVLFTTFFTNSNGIITGLVGSLGHWVAQQDVGRGGQPIYYFALVQIPIYEFLGAFGTLAAIVIGFKGKSFWEKFPKSTNEDALESKRTLLPVPAIFIFWTLTSLIAYSIAGEKMPWLTVHIAFSMLLTAGWVIEKLINSRSQFMDSRGEQAKYFFLVLIFVFLICLILVQIWGNHAPFQGKTQQQLGDTNHFLIMTGIAGICAYFLFRKKDRINHHKLKINIYLALFLILSVITVRSAYRASFINYDYPFEYLVYAHASDGPKIILEQVEEISKRLTGGLDIKVAYDNHGLYPYWWYFRDYPNKIMYMEDPTRTLEEAELIIAGSDKYAKIDAIVRDNYYVYEYMRLWWPMQDYMNLTWERISNALSSTDIRQALFNIWFNRDYTEYAAVNNNDYLTLNNWLPSERMRFYVRKDIAAQMWQLNTEASIQQVVATDPYAENMQSRQPDSFIGIAGSALGDLNTPHGIDIGPDGAIYVADSGNNRIQKFATDGTLLDSWGTYASVLEDDAPGGTMNEPWDVAVSGDGSIYIADTFNHRIQKLTADGKFVKMWGTFAQGEDPESMWGPRGIAIDPQGNVLVTDTGNKRVLVFDENLNYVTQFGGAGFEAGELDEPVGIAISNSGQVVIADTWNRRVQIFEPDESGLNYIQVGVFDVEAWYGTGIDNKPYVAISPDNTILVSDPEGVRILEFSMEGEYIRGWQDLSVSIDMLSQPYGMDFDGQGNLWICDGASSKLLVFYPQVNE